jgi:hypothetical protein
MRISILCILFFYCSVLLPCPKKDVNIEIVECKSLNSDIVVSILISNYTEDIIKTYIPQINDLCNGIIKITFIDKSKPYSNHNVFPCNWIADLDLIILNDSNSIILNSNDTYQQKLIISKKFIVPKLHKGSYYQIQIEWWFSSVNFNLNNVFNDNVKSNMFYFHYK